MRMTTPRKREISGIRAVFHGERPPVTGRPGWFLLQSPRCRPRRFTGKFVGRLCLAAPPTLAPPGISTDTPDRTASDRPSRAFFDPPPAQTQTAGFAIPLSVTASASAFRSGAQVRGGDDVGMSTSGKHRVIAAGAVRGGGDHVEAGDESRATVPGHPPIPPGRIVDHAQRPTGTVGTGSRLVLALVSCGHATDHGDRAV